MALQIYFTLLPIFGGAPVWTLRLFGSVLAAAGAFGLAGTLRLIWREWRDLDVRSVMWLLAAAAIAILSLRTAIGLRFYRMFSG